jgi:orotidine-5'-phosphate decarboxylase
MMSQKLIIALDFADKNLALEFTDQINPEHCALKVGLEMFTLFGPEFVRTLINRQFKIFLDLKFHDIPNTVARACKAGAELGVWMMNVHAVGGYNMMLAAREALDEFGSHRPLLIAVTVLTSMDESELSSLGVNKSMPQQVSDLALLTQQAGLDGIVCSALETAMIKNKFGPKFLTITPGVRLVEDAKDDQMRVVTPEQAINAGSDYLVIGRPVTRSSTPAKVVARILASIVD